MTPVTPRELVTLLIIGGGLWALIQFTGLKFWHAALVFGTASTSRQLPPDRRSAIWRPSSRSVRALGPA